MKIKIISLLLCLVAISVFAGCNNNSEESTTTTPTTTEATESTTDATVQSETITKDSNSNNSTTKVIRDSKLVGKWIAATKIPVDEKGNSVTSNCTIVFKKDGTFSQVTSEKQARQTIVDTYMLTFGCTTEKELDLYLRKNTKNSLETHIAMAMANLTKEDMNTTGTWRTEDGTLYETTFNGTRNVTESLKYTVSADGKTAKISIKSGDSDTITMILTKA